jgi:hypothetical protein
MAYLCDLLNIYDVAFFNFYLKETESYCVFLLSSGIICISYTAKTSVFFCPYLQQKQIEEIFVNVLKVFNSSNTIYQITTLQFMKD